MAQGYRSEVVFMDEARDFIKSLPASAKEITRAEQLRKKYYDSKSK